jgi:hypothetical protein
MSNRLYPIKDSAYYFRAGRLPDGTQVLIGRWGNEAVCIRFSTDGEPLGLDAYPIEPATDVPDPELERVVARLRVRAGIIRVATFAFPERTIGIRELPDYLQEYVDSPASAPAGSAGHLAKAVAEWTRREAFVLVWCEEYEMNREGEVEST